MNKEDKLAFLEDPLVWLDYVKERRLRKLEDAKIEHHRKVSVINEEYNDALQKSKEWADEAGWIGVWIKGLDFPTITTMRRVAGRVMMGRRKAK